MNLLLKELRKFAKNNWWVFIVLFLCLIVIYITWRWNIYEVLIIFLLHFLGDLLIMMMWDYYAIKKYKEWSITQFWSSIIFTIISLYAWFIFGKWHYLLPQISFWLSAFKSYFKEVRKKDIIFINWGLLVLVNIIIIIIDYYLWFIWTIYYFIQILWFALFSTALVLKNDKVKYFISLAWIFMVPFWALISVYYSFLGWSIKGVDISYMLLPLTVLIVYLKNLKKYL